MEKKNSNYVLEQVAQKHGVPVEEVISEIEEALANYSVRDAAIKEMSAMEAVTYFRDLAIKRMRSH